MILLAIAVALVGAAVLVYAALAVGVYVMLARVARGDYENED